MTPFRSEEAAPLMPVIGSEIFSSASAGGASWLANRTTKLQSYALFRIVPFAANTMIKIAHVQRGQFHGIGRKVLPTA